MMHRQGFVSNSSSSSFVLMHNFKKVDDLMDHLEKVFKKKFNVFSKLAAQEIMSSVEEHDYDKKDSRFLSSKEKEIVKEYKHVIFSCVEGFGDGGNQIGDALAYCNMRYKDYSLYFRKRAGHDM